MNYSMATDPSLSNTNHFDPSKRAEAILDHILDTELSVEANSGPKVSVKEALRSRPVLDSDTGRNKA